MKNPFKSAAGRIEEEKIYESIAHEIAEGSVRAGLWTKAVSEAGGNEPQIQSNYIKLRFQNILDEMALQEEEERLKAEKLAEEERLKAEKLAEEERLKAEKLEEEERLKAEKLAEEERLKAEKIAAELRLKAEKLAAEEGLEEREFLTERHNKTTLLDLALYLVIFGLPGVLVVLALIFASVG